MAVIVTVIGTVAAMVYPMDNITDFLYLIGSVFAPMIAIQIADFFLLKQDASGPECTSDQSGRMVDRVPCVPDVDAWICRWEIRCRIW